MTPRDAIREIKNAAIGLSEISHSGVEYWMSVSLSSLNEWISIFNQRLREKKRK